MTDRRIGDQLERMLKMLTWRDYQEAEARRDRMMEQAARQRQIQCLPKDETRMQAAVRSLASLAGGWLIELGLRLQSQSIEVAEGLRQAHRAPVSGGIKRAEQNC